MVKLRDRLYSRGPWRALSSSLGFAALILESVIDEMSGQDWTQRAPMRGRAHCRGRFVGLFTLGYMPVLNRIQRIHLGPA